LPSVDGVAHRRSGVVASGLIMPKMHARPRVQRDEISVTNRREDQAAGCRQEAVGQRALKRLEIPYRLARFRIERLDARTGQRLVRSTGCGVGRGTSADVLSPAFDLGRSAHVLLAGF